MANTLKYLNHLVQRAGITPACSEEEREAAELIADVYRNHGFNPEIQEFNAPTFTRLPHVIIGILLFLGSILYGIGGAAGIVGFVMIVASTALYFLDRFGRLEGFLRGGTGLSQNVIAYHKASGPLASPRNRPVVIVAHYDSPRADMFSRPELAPYRPLMMKLMPFACAAPVVLAILSLLPIPGFLRTVFWILSLVCAALPLFNAVCIIMNKFFLPYTSGSVCNKSSVAAMLGVMDAVSPFHGENEFPDDIPAERFASTYRYSDEAGEEPSEEDQQFLSALASIQDNINNADFSVEELAAKLNISRGYLYKKIVKITGKTTLEFIRLIRLNRAAELLLQGHNVNQAAADTGFVNVKYFSVLFKKHFGIQPGKYAATQA